MLFSARLSLLSIASLLLTSATAAPFGNSSISERALATGQVLTNCKKAKDFAVTFDDGPVEYSASLLPLFAKYKSKTTYFVNGNNYRCIYDQAEYIKARVAAGHQIGSHTWNHVDITTITAAQLNNQLTLVEEALWKIAGVKPRWFRPPYGAINSAQKKVLAARGYQIALWSVDSCDSCEGTTPAESIATYHTLANKKGQPPQMTLNHETYQSTVSQVMPQVVPLLISKGYKLVTVAQCMGDTPYQATGKAGTRDATWTCNGTPQPGVN